MDGNVRTASVQVEGIVHGRPVQLRIPVHCSCKGVGRGRRREPVPSLRGQLQLLLCQSKLQGGDEIGMQIEVQVIYFGNQCMGCVSVGQQCMHTLTVLQCNFAISFIQWPADHAQ